MNKVKNIFLWLVAFTCCTAQVQAAFDVWVYNKENYPINVKLTTNREDIADTKQRVEPGKAVAIYQNLSANAIQGYSANVIVEASAPMGEEGGVLGGVKRLLQRSTGRHHYNNIIDLQKLTNININNRDVVIVVQEESSGATGTILEKFAVLYLNPSLDLSANVEQFMLPYYIKNILELSDLEREASRKYLEIRETHLLSPEELFPFKNLFYYFIAADKLLKKIDKTEKDFTLTLGAQQNRSAYFDADSFDPEERYKIFIGTPLNEYLDSIQQHKVHVKQHLDYWFNEYIERYVKPISFDYYQNKLMTIRAIMENAENIEIPVGVDAQKIANEMQDEVTKNTRTLKEISLNSPVKIAPTRTVETDVAIQRQGRGDLRAEIINGLQILKEKDRQLRKITKDVLYEITEYDEE